MMRTLLTVDNSGLIVSYSDGADSCCRNYTFHVRNLILRKFGLGVSNVSIVADPQKTQKLLEVKPGIYIRNPNKWQTMFDTWYSTPQTTSRDQLTPVFCYNAMAAYHGNMKGQRALSRLLWACLKRGMLAQNIYKNGPDQSKWKLPDFITPDIWGIALRGYGLWVMPLVVVLDIFMFLSVVVRLWAPIAKDGTLQFRMPGPTDTDDDNINNVLMTAQYTYDTPFSWLARKFYKWFRKKSYKMSIVDALQTYHTAMGSVELADMARPIVERY